MHFYTIMLISANIIDQPIYSGSMIYCIYFIHIIFYFCIQITLKPTCWAFLNLSSSGP